MEQTTTVAEMVERLKKAREQSGLTPKQASLVLGQAKDYVEGVESGATELTMKTLLSLCVVYDVQPAYVLTGRDENDYSALVAMMRSHDIYEDAIQAVLELLRGRW